MSSCRPIFPLLVSLCTFAASPGYATDFDLWRTTCRQKEQAAAVEAHRNIPDEHGRQPCVARAQAIMTEIVTWLAENFELPATYEHPRLEVVPASEITFMRFGAFTASRQREILSAMHNADARGPAREVLAIYSDATKTIFLADGWTGRSTAEMSVLVHEMVHHLQRAGGLVYACPAERETLAYAAQDKWLNQFGTSLAAEFDLDSFTLLASTRCMH